MNSTSNFICGQASFERTMKVLTEEELARLEIKEVIDIYLPEEEGDPMVFTTTLI